MHDLYRQQHDGDDHGQHDQRAVARAVRRRSAPAAASSIAGCGRPSSPSSCALTGSISRDDGDGKDAEQHAAGGKRRRARRARSGRRRCAYARCGSRGRPRKIDAVELHHHVRGQRDGQHQRRRRERHQHVDERLRQARREQERLQQQPFGDEAVERRQAGDRQRADEREPRDPRHPVDQSAELAEAALVRRVQHRAGGEEQQALEERVIERSDRATAVSAIAASSGLS